jgi:hypothetical protein
MGRSLSAARDARAFVGPGAGRIARRRMPARATPDVIVHPKISHVPSFVSWGP